MKIIVRLLLFFFLTFLSAPTIVSLLEKKGDVSFCFDNSETDEFQKDLKSEFVLESFNYIFLKSQKISIAILSENLSKHDNISKKIVIPPPDTI